MATHSFLAAWVAGKASIRKGSGVGRLSGAGHKRLIRQKKAGALTPAFCLPVKLYLDLSNSLAICMLHGASPLLS